jgi:large subunit ribosomal protein L17
MRHARSGKKLGRDSAHRKALYSNLAGALITHGRIETTEAKAKAVKPFAEKMITLGKRGDPHARRFRDGRASARTTSSTSCSPTSRALLDRTATPAIKLGAAGRRRLDGAAELVDFEPSVAVPPWATREVWGNGPPSWCVGGRSGLSADRDQGRCPGEPGGSPSWCGARP